MLGRGEHCLDEPLGDRLKVSHVGLALGRCFRGLRLRQVLSGLFGILTVLREELARLGDLQAEVFGLLHSLLSRFELGRLRAKLGRRFEFAGALLNTF